MYFVYLPSVCTPGSIRLMDGNSTQEGRVEICYNETYNSICDDRWDELEAAVVCRQLNYTEQGEFLQTKILTIC